MSSRTRIWGACRTLAVRTAPMARPFPTTAIRMYSTGGSEQPPKAVDNGLKDTATMSKSPSNPQAAGINSSAEKQPVGNGSQNASETPGEAQSEVLGDAALEQLIYGGRTATSTTEGGLTPSQEQALYNEGIIPSPDIVEVLMAEKSGSETGMAAAEVGELQNPGHKFGLPKKPYPEGFNLKQRYHPVLEQLTRLLMRDGKLSVAQRNMAMVMNFLRTAPAPIYSPKFPLLPGTPPASHLPLNPVLYITIAIDSVAPLIKVRNVAGAGGGGRALELPVPLAVRQRRRLAVKWILDVIEKKPSKGSGRKQFPHRIAEEIIAVVEGRSSVWEKRRQVHKLGTAARANVGSRKLKVKKKM